MPKTPLVNEDALVASLTWPTALATYGSLSVSAGLALVDAYDRVKRDEFLGISELSGQLLKTLARLQLLAAIQKYAGDDGAITLTPATVKELFDGFTQKAEELRKNLHHKMNLVSQCPYAGDTVH